MRRVLGLAVLMAATSACRTVGGGSGVRGDEVDNFDFRLAMPTALSTGKPLDPSLLGTCTGAPVEALEVWGFVDGETLRGAFATLRRAGLPTLLFNVTVKTVGNGMQVESGGSFMPPFTYAERTTLAESIQLSCDPWRGPRAFAAAPSQTNGFTWAAQNAGTRTTCDGRGGARIEVFVYEDPTGHRIDGLRESVALIKGAGEPRFTKGVALTDEGRGTPRRVFKATAARDFPQIAVLRDGSDETIGDLRCRAQ